MKSVIILGITVGLAGCQSTAARWEDPAGDLADSSVVELADSPTPPSDFGAPSPDDTLSISGQQFPELPAPRSLDLDPAGLENASVELVSAYLELTDQIAAGGGANSDAMASVVTAEWLATEERGFAHYRDTGIRTIGTTVFDNLAVQSARRTAQGELEVAVFVCVDSTNVWVVDAALPDPPEDLVVWLGAGEDRVEPSDEQYLIWQEYLDLADPTAGAREPIILWLLGSQLDRLRVDATESWSGVSPCGVSE